jgi:hypothetical protein
MLEEWATVTPTRVSRLSRRKKEEVKDWWLRLLEGLEQGTIPPPANHKKPKKDLLQQRSARTIELLHDGPFGLSLEEIQQSVLPVEALFIPESDESYPTGSVELDTNSLAQLRLCMDSWTQAHFAAHLEEANCDLQCQRCPSAKLLGCALDNADSSSQDGHTDIRDLLMGI